MKFKKDKKYSWVYNSETFKLNVYCNDNDIESTEIARFEYRNYYNFYACDKPRTFNKKPANYALEFQVRDVYTINGGVCVKGEKYWRTVEVIDNFETKKEMMAEMNSIIESFKKGWKLYNQWNTYHIYKEAK